MRPTWLVTGGAGFIGSAFVRAARSRDLARIVSLDLLTYAGNMDNLASLEGDPGHRFYHGDICDARLVSGLLAEHRPAALVNFAAESHVDRSIHDAAPFLRTNVHGTLVLLAAARNHLEGRPEHERDGFRFLHVSTDEVYGSLGPRDAPFTEDSPYAPNSPYAASKAAADHLVRAWNRTYGLPTLVTNCSNNYGPFQFPEKLVPLVICNAREGKTLPIYGDGLQVRDWIHVDDHCDALFAILADGRPGETYNVGGNAERANLDLVRRICAALDAIEPASEPRERLIRHVTDRPGHDRRYGIDASKLAREIGWSARIDLADGIRDTVRWYAANPTWVDRARSGAYRDWIDRNYGSRPEALP